MKTLLIIFTIASTLIISCKKNNNNNNNSNTQTSLINPPQQYWGDYYSKTSWGTYSLIATISKDDVVYIRESLSLKYKNHGLAESIGNQYILTTTFSASPQIGDFHKYTITTLTDSTIRFEAKQNGITKWELIKK
jgi:hypothetical protein